MIQSVIGMMRNYDPDAAAYITATGLTGATNHFAVHYIFRELKNIGVWSKIRAGYLFLGGSSVLHKWNFKDPRDLDGAFRLIFTNTTHSSTGATANGTSGFADTKFNPSLIYPGSDSAHMAFYSRTNNAAGNRQEMGAVTVGAADTGLVARFTGDLFYPSWHDTGTAYPSATVTNSSGLFMVNRVDSAHIQAWRSGTKLTLSPNDSQSGGLVNRNIYLFARNLSSGVDRFSNRQCAFASIGDGLTDTEGANLYTVVQNYQTILGRQI